MARRSPIDILLAKRGSALAAAIPAARSGDAEAVHQARVASRRLREVVPVLEAVAPSARRAGAAVRRVTRALGPVRELDVTTGLYAEETSTSLLHPLARVVFERTLARRRATAVREMRKVLGRASLARTTGALDVLAADVADTPVMMVAAAVRDRVAQRGRRLESALAELGVLYVPERLHAVRIAVKQLRYALEIAGDLRLARTVSALRHLRAVQDLLGRAHDLQVLADHVREGEGKVVMRSRPAARDLRRLARRIDNNCRQLHAVFLSRHAALRALASSLAAGGSASARRSAA